jgi:hypothetical protein
VKEIIRVMKKIKLFKNLRLILASMLIFVGLSAPLYTSSGQPVYAQNPKDTACLAINSIDGGGGCDAGTAKSKLSGIVSTIVNILSMLVGAASVIMIIMGGFKYVTSNGDANSTKSAKDTIMYALIGLLLVGFAQTIVRFVWSQS